METKLSLRILSPDNKTHLCDLAKLPCLLKALGCNFPHRDHTNWGPVLRYLKGGFLVLSEEGRAVQEVGSAGKHQGRQVASTLPRESELETRTKNYTTILLLQPIYLWASGQAHFLFLLRNLFQLLIMIAELWKWNKKVPALVLCSQ